MEDKEVINESLKRPISNNCFDENSDEFVGPQLSQFNSKSKTKIKRIENESLYLDDIPLYESYEISYMHRDVLSHVFITKTNFIITTSLDGHLKFWKKQASGIEFVKHFRCHLGNILFGAVSLDGHFFATIGDDKHAKIFDVINFDMINIVSLGFLPTSCEFVYSENDAIKALAISEENSIHIFDATDANSKKILSTSKLHKHKILCMKYFPKISLLLTIDQGGMIEYSNPKTLNFPFSILKFAYKTDTDLYKLAQNKVAPVGQNAVAISHNEPYLFAVYADDKKIYIFKALAGKLIKLLDESLSSHQELQDSREVIPKIEYLRRLAFEKDLDKFAEFRSLQGICFDQSDNFILFPTLFGIKVINFTSNKCVKIIGKNDNLRFLCIALFQGSIISSCTDAASHCSIESQASDNYILSSSIIRDPTLVCTAFRKNRFYLFTKRCETVVDDESFVRDIYNEKPSREEILTAIDDDQANPASNKLPSTCIIYTSYGDIHCQLYPNLVPRTIENFSVHAKNAYYNRHIFHRIIKSFMIQTGDPKGNGTGGESIWGGDFEDEFTLKLKHDKPYTLSMANSGPNSNASQFFITVVPCSWLDNKHTIFGRVYKGMDVVQSISNARTDPKTDKPFEDIYIISISCKE